MNKIFIVFTLLGLISFFFIERINGLDIDKREVASVSVNSCITAFNGMSGKPVYFDQIAYKEIESVLNDVFTLDEDIIIGAKSPSWQEFDAIEKAIKVLESIENKYEFPSDFERNRFFNYVLGKFFKNNEKKFASLLNKSENYEYPEKWEPIQYEMTFQFRIRFEKFNAYLPKGLRFKFKEFPADTFNEVIIKEAEGIYDELVGEMADLFPTTGYASYTSLLKHNTQVSKESNGIAKIIRDEEYEFAMNRPSNARWWTPKVGFHNQHVTGSSRGFMGVDRRNVAEASLIGVDFEDFARANGDLKPKYGYLRKKVDSDLIQNMSSYGDDVYIFDKEKVRKRITFTPGDSLIRQESRSPNNSSRRISTTPEIWDDIFIPIEFEELIIPFLAENMKIKNFSISRAGSSYPNSLGMRNSSATAYLELQYWGPIRLDDVKEFIFTTRVPEPEFLKELAKRNIKVWDGRSHPPKEFDVEFEEIEMVTKVKVDRIKHQDFPDKLLTEEEYTEYLSSDVPFGNLSKIDRSFGATEARGSNMPNWYVDEKGVQWILKPDSKHFSELQTAAEVISSRIYKHLGFKVPVTQIVEVDGKRYAAVKSLGEGLVGSSLANNQSEQWKQVYFIGALLKDNDRIYNAKNNFDLGGDDFMMFDFGGTLGSKAQGEHKEPWDDDTVFSDAVGYFENSDDIDIVWKRYADRYKAEGHAWHSVDKNDAQIAVESLKKLSDADVRRFVLAAQYSRDEDANYMIEAIIKRRDTLIKDLLAQFE